MIRLFFGSPGAGKTTLAVRLMLKEKRRGVQVLSNFDTSISDFFNCSDLESFYPPKYAHITVDESGIVFNNRKFKTLSQGIIEYFKLHRHNYNDIDFYSQSFDDTDITIRRLATEYWNVKKVGFFTVCRRYFPRVMVDEQTHQIVTGFYKRSPLWQLLPGQPKQFMFCFRPLYYKYFDSYYLPPRQELRVVTPEERKALQS